MILKVVFAFIILAWTSYALATEPTNAIEWFNQSSPEVKESHHDIKPKKEDTTNVLINKSNLRPSNLNSVGIIPSQITGIDPNIWQKINEAKLFAELNELPYLNFHAAQTFLKRILISETNPPTPSNELAHSGKLYFIAKLDKLIQMGALDEAETLISQSPQSDPIIFDRLVKIGSLTGRMGEMCKMWQQNQELNIDLSLRIVCLAELNDWNAAVLILSSAANLRLLDRNREKLLLNYLDQNQFPTDSIQFTSTNFNHIDIYLLSKLKNFQSVSKNEIKYNYIRLKTDPSYLEKIIAAEHLAKSKAINASTLLDVYRSSSIQGSNPFWKRVISIKNLDLAMYRNNDKLTGMAVHRTVQQMFQGRLLFALAAEYGTKLSQSLIDQNQNKINDSYAIIFSINEEIPLIWQTYNSKNKYINMALKIAKKDTIDVLTIQKAMTLIQPTFQKSLIFNEKRENFDIINLEKDNNKSETILKALKKSAAGIKTEPAELFSALLMFLEADEPKLVKSILIEYLIYSSGFERQGS